MTKEEKTELFKPKEYALYENGTFIWAYPSHNAAKRALHEKLMEAKKYPYDYADSWFEIKPYKPNF